MPASSPGRSQESLATPLEGPWQRFSARSSPLVTICFAIYAAVIAFIPLFRHDSWIPYLEDDFFYYLKIAINLSHGRGSTFNGIVPTNGYHPLWLLLLTALCRISTSPTAIQIFLAAAIFLATFTTYLLSRRLLSLTAANPLLTSGLAIYIALYAMHLFAGGMEIILTIPLLLAVALAYQDSRIWEPGFWPAAGFGLLLCALVLSRLDTIVLVALLGAATLLHPALRARIGGAQASGVIVGVLPIAAYFLSNRIFFHTWLTVSGMAKQLKPNHLPTYPAWHSLFSKTPAQLLNLIPIFIAIALLPVLYRKLSRTQQVLYPLLLAFPFIYIALLSCLSDWRLWDWYFYSLRISLCIGFTSLLLWQPSRRLINLPIVAVAVLLVVFAQMLRTGRSPVGGFPIYLIALDLQEFAATHPGVYAMGDRAGMTSYLIDDPLVQTEGLVMDRQFLSLIQARTPLRDALRPYHVRYYVAQNEEPLAPCYHAAEPRQAGPASPHLVADLCQPPVAIYTHPDSQTLIFDLQQ